MPRAARVGGKAAALEVARTAGLPVPPFLTLTVDDVAALAQGGPRSVAVESRLRDEVIRLGAGRLAVRSSAQCEDGARSFAGQFDTRLDVLPEDVVTAVREVADSAARPRVAAYEQATGVTSGGLGVVVQVMVDGRWAGVAFSRDPLTYQPEVLVEAVSGPGEALVSGRLTPTRAWAARDGSRELEVDLREPVPEHVLQEAAGLALRCESVFGRPQDVEWVHDGSGIHVVQSRDLTGFETAEVFSDTWSAEVWPGLIKPLVFDVGDVAVNAAWGRILTSVAGPLELDWRRMAGLAGSRVYFNETLLGQVMARAGLPENTLEGVVRGERPRLREASLPRLAASGGRIARFLSADSRWLVQLDRDLPPLRSRVEVLTEQVRDVEASELATQLDALLEVLEEAAYLSARTTMSLGMRALYVRAAHRLARGDGPAPQATASAGTGPVRALARVTHELQDATTEERATIESGDARAIAEVLASSSHGRRAQAAMDDLLDRWGHVATVNTDFSTPAWRDDPTRLWRLALASRAEAPDAPAEEATPAAPGLRGRLLAHRTQVLRQFVDARDEVNDLLALTYDAWRQAARSAGTALAPGTLPSADLVHFLTLAELREALQGRPAPGLAGTASRRAEQLAQDAELHVPHRLWDLRLPPRQRLLREAEPVPGGRAGLRGVPASSGVLVGRARIVRSPLDADHLHAGDVLVADHADIGWTPLFSIAGAVVTGAGGALSHAAVVARELGIPAVVGVADATRHIPDGALVVVDGSDGVVGIEAEDGSDGWSSGMGGSR